MRKNLIPETLNICLIADRFPVIGQTPIRGFIAPIARGLVRSGHRVSVIAWDNTIGVQEVEQEGIKTYFVSGPNPLRKELFPQKIQQKFLQLHSKDPFHLVHSLTPASTLLGSQKRKLGIATAYDVTATSMSEMFSIIGMAENTVSSQLKTAYKVVRHFLRTYSLKDRALLASADGVFVHSQQQKLALERYYLYPENKTYSIPYGIEIQDLSERQGSEQLKTKLNIPRSSKVVVTVSDMIEKMDVVNVLKAFQLVAIKKPTARLIIVGHGPAFEEIELEMLNLALGSHVIMVGQVPNYEISSYIDLADVFVNMSGRITGYDPNLLEAMIQKKIIIGSEVSALSTLVEDGIDGYLIRPADVIALSQILMGLFLGQIHAEVMGENARNKAINMFDTKKMISETLSAYESILHRSPRVFSQELKKTAILSEPSGLPPLH